MTDRVLPRRTLRRVLMGVGLVQLLLLSSGLLLKRKELGLEGAAVWAAKVAAVMIIQQLILLGNRERILSGPNLQHLSGGANILSLARGMMIALMAGYLFSAQPPGIAGWLPALLYTLQAILDFLDGFWARRSGTQTRMGEILDQEYDGLGLLIAMALVVQWANLPAGFFCLALAKYAFSAGVAWLRVRGRPVHALPPSYMRRRLAGFQMGIVAVLLWPIARPPGTTLAMLIVGVPILLGFLRDWLVVSGALDPGNSRYLRIKRNLQRIGGIWLPPFGRLVLAAVLLKTVFTLLGTQSEPTAWLAAITGVGVLPAAYTAARLLLLALLIAGVVTSPAALALLLLEGLRIFTTRLDLWAVMVVCAALFLYIFGPGPPRLVLHPRGKSRT